MKIGFISSENIQEHTHATVRGMAEGGAFGIAGAGGASYYLQRTSHAYRALPISLKMLPALIFVLPCITIQAERRGLEYERKTWQGEQGMSLLQGDELEAEKRWQGMSTQQKLGDWASRHEWSIILGSWAGALGLSGAIISRNKYQSFPQKIVQARMWAQGLTVGILIAAGALQGMKRRGAAREDNVDHSWREILAEQAEQDKKHARA